uniref:DNA-directed RNA polymerase n=1 Tax=Rhipilia penicilloides TaxID=1979422 RepID=A0A2P0QHJ7_9CHLO|nr:RNA polymerase b-subunit [Rhipilia penicilloides]ARO74244.1 RNA polymerase b-subunit [Rhipilia penicilloides]
MFFLFYKFLFFVVDFLEIQRKSFYKFLHFQLREELSKIPSLSFSQTRSNQSKQIGPFPSPSFPRIALPNFSYRSVFSIPKMFVRKTALSKTSFLRKTQNKRPSPSEEGQICFVYQYFRYLPPVLTIEQSLLLSKTYCCHFYVPIQFHGGSRNGNGHLTQWIFLGTLPLLTRRGHFIINGTPRIVINQMVRSPGIYFQQNTRFFYTEIISERGPWIRLEIDKKNKIWVSLISQQSGWTRIDFSFFFQTFYPKYLDLLEAPKNLIALQKSRNFVPWSPTQSSLRKGRFPANSLKTKLVFPLNWVNCGLFINCPLLPSFQPILDFHLLNTNHKIVGRNRFAATKAAVKSKSKPKQQGIFQKSRVRDSEMPSTVVGRKSALFASSSKSANMHFYLGKNGRLQLNTKLGLSIHSVRLTPLDFLVIRNLLFQFRQGQENVLLDDIDNLKNRQFKTIGDLLQNQLAIGFQRLYKLFENPKFPLSSSMQFLKKKKISSPLRDPNWPSTFVNQKFKKPKTTFNTLSKNTVEAAVLSVCVSSIIKNQPITSVLKEFFHSHQLSQFLDQSNPLAELTHKRRLSCLGSGGINRETAGMDIRGIHPSHYGRICPIETPEGKNAGLVNSLTNLSKIDPKGGMKTPYTEVYRHHYQNQRKLVFLSLDNQPNHMIWFHRKLPKLKHVSVSRLKKLNFQKCPSPSINFVAFHPHQFLSIATSCIPFIEHDDANRALMGSNMQRQALPLLACEQPYVTTVHAFRVMADLNDIPTSSKSGLVFYLSQYKICLYFGRPHRGPWPKTKTNRPFSGHFCQYFQHNCRPSLMGWRCVRIFQIPTSPHLPIDFH